MTLEVTPSALDVGRAFAERYADGDFELVARLLAPDVHQREITPNNLVEFHTAEEVVAEGRDFLAAYAGHATVLLEVYELAGRVCTRTRWRLFSRAETSVVEWFQFLDIEGDLIVKIDALCSGPQAER